ncbi:hypothetical protein EV360DRAFT_35959 [Lentinula raphanica]|nr:hypothetical protein EV360DRAFT_35959 [Lentinula raphanica]
MAQYQTFVQPSNAPWLPVGRLSAFYPNAAYDFYGTPSSPLCVYKTGNPWPVRTGMESQRIIREARPVQPDHPIQAIWPAIGESLYKLLDSKKVRWTSIDPVAFAEAGKEPFCPLLLWIGVEPASLSYEDARAAAEAATSLLSESGLDGFEIGFRESVIIRSNFRPKMLSYDSLDPDDPDIEFRRPFTPILGLPISLRKRPHHEGTGALYLREKEGSDRIYLLTCSHVVRLPDSNHPPDWESFHEKVIVLGQKSFNDAVQCMEDRMESDADNMELCQQLISENSGESERDRLARERLSTDYENIENDKKKVDKWHSKIIKHWTLPDARVIGRIAYAPPVSNNNEFKYTEDWALIELDNDKFDWTTFEGNQVYVDKKTSYKEYSKVMYPNAADRKNFRYPKNGLLQVSSRVISEEEVRHPQHLDKDGDKCWFVLKNGLATGTTFGRTSGMKSYTRTYSGSEEITALEIGILSYSNKEGPFSGKGDSGSIILTRDGSILGMMTGGAAGHGTDADRTANIDVTYATPFCFILEQIRKVPKFSNCHPY